MRRRGRSSFRFWLGACVVGALAALFVSCSGTSDTVGRNDGGANDAGACPPDIPAWGAFCPCGRADGAAVPPFDCEYPDPCVDGEVVTAHCDARCYWTILPDRCDFPYCGVPGSESVCAPDEICRITRVRGGQFVYAGCGSNVCGEEPLSCGCACADTAGECVEVDDHEIECNCSGCS